MTSLGVVHVVFSLVAMSAGAVVLGIPKGTRWHRTFGHLYATAMVGTVATSLSLYTLTGSFGPFHIAAILAALTLAVGMYAVLMRRPRAGWMGVHAAWMSGSYVGLIAAFVAESLTRFAMPRLLTHLGLESQWIAFWITVAAATTAVVIVGIWLIRKHLPAALHNTPAVMRSERSGAQGARDLP